MLVGYLDNHVAATQPNHHRHVVAFQGNAPNAQRLLAQHPVQGLTVMAGPVLSDRSHQGADFDGALQQRLPVPITR